MDCRHLDLQRWLTGTAWARSRPHYSPAWWLRMSLVTLALAAIALGFATRALANTPSAAQRLVGSPAPAFALPAEARGQPLPGTVTLEQQHGHPVLLAFFYTLCAHCLTQMQTVRDVSARYADRSLGMLYIDSPGEPATLPAAYLDRVGIESPVLLDRHAAVAARYGIRFYPTLILVDAQGTVRAVWTGDTSAAALGADIEHDIERSP
jgi:peroxiredoxin